ncbi:biopolymer transporter Tol [Brachybacterium sp. UNK5269]|uniref:biopolymer transporter Tol n=1 Tax=Brachybacterium sp. UNK5269 TaxID=3408576 RepID=UPI003BB01EE6
MPADGGPERTEDGRYIIVKGRRWRATDPVLDEDVAAALRSELGRARSALRTARDAEEVAGWRARVQLAKEGLGERGAEWWTLTEPERHERARERLCALRAQDDA